MRSILTLLFLFVFACSAYATGAVVDYQVNGEPYEGYYISPAPGASLVLLIHDWDGLTD